MELKNQYLGMGNLLIMHNLVFHICVAGSQFNFSDLEFPDSLLFGAATASYQIEGAWNVSGKGENIWDHLTHFTPQEVISKDNGDVACDSYHKYKEDVKIIKDIGFQFYRFSLSWSRLYNEGYITQINEEGLRYYNSLIDELLANDIEPVITLYHWDLPQSLQDVGGWLNSTIVDIFGDYTRACYRHFGDRVKWWLTINEPRIAVRGYSETSFAPMLNMHGVGDYIAGHNMLKAHARAYKIYDNEFRSTQGGKVSLPFFGNFYFPRNESSLSDIEAAERANQFTLGWFAHPIFDSEGDYPKIMREYIDKKSFAEGKNESRLPSFSQEEINEIKGSCDYFGLNHYSSKLAEQGLTGEEPSVERDMEVLGTFDPTWPDSAYAVFKVVPKGLRGVLKWIKEHYNNPDIFITENGFADTGDLDDKGRVAYYQGYLKELSLAINKDGCRVLGYSAWSLMDNFEWKQGYSIKYGIVHVNFSDPARPRTKKLSAQFFKELMEVRSSNKSTLTSLSFVLMLTFFIMNIIHFIF